MKKFKALSIVAACIAAFAFSSCNTGSDNSWTPLTANEKAYAYNQTAGAYTGKMVYYSEEHATKNNDVLDTLTVTWSLYGNSKDTAMTVQNFPIKVMAKYIKSTDDTKPLIEALKNYNGPVVSLKSNVYYYSTNPINFLLNPDVMTCNLTYGEATHKVSFYFYTSYINSISNYGTFDPSSKAFAAMIYAGGYKVDAKDDDKTQPTKFDYTVASGTPYEQALTVAPFLFSTNLK